MATTAPPECCTTGYIFAGTPTGKEEKLNGLDCYVAMPPSNSTATSILICHDIFGWKMPNTRLVADALAKEGFAVFVPDFFNGYSAPPPNALDISVAPAATMWGRFVQVGRALSVVPSVAYTVINTKSKYGALAKSFAAFLKEKHSVAKLGSIGYCFGGHDSLLLGSISPPLADAVAEAHAGEWSSPPSKDAENLVVPALFIFSDKDFSLKDADRKGVIETLEERNKEEKTKGWFDFHVYAPSTMHGFAIRCNEDDPVQKAERDLALANTKAFFKKWLLDGGAKL
ncbi:alpha/beta-hydrolase [Gonapodya prolifera JEL478]|uniref:Alpha/beta-hydrolase n=1 Tax=Gonapodya prolifera (strain JEL478) TaxID=1344416 RepID=A0A139AAH7_GONPJ|nr:alpha/beta-hydrolase [Gonapodya prolifera JEL478]|eukprot:KXS13737.1 alpha/beta-hydrolase [Gonapodya prolifera JEL478]